MKDKEEQSKYYLSYQSRLFKMWSRKIEILML